jgi:TBC1 domain family member 5
VPNGPATLVQDAIFLDRNRTSEAGTSLIARYSGFSKNSSEHTLSQPRRPPALQLNHRHGKTLSPGSRSRASPARSPARFLSPQKGLESLFQEVSGTLQKRTEGVSKAVRAAAGEMRRNVNNFQSGTPSSRNSLDATQTPPSQQSPGQETMEDLKRRLSTFEKRNKALAKMLADALEELRSQKESTDPKETTVAESSFNIALAKMQFVQVYLADSDIPIPGQDGLPNEGTHEDLPRAEETNDLGSALVRQTDPDVAVLATHCGDATPGRISTPTLVVPSNLDSRARDEGAEVRPIIQVQERDKGRVSPLKLSSAKPRPPLAQSPLSWILGEGQHRSDFVSSSTPPPEQKRDSVPKVRPKRLFPEGKDGEARNDSESEDDGFTLSSLHGSPSKK